MTTKSYRPKQAAELLGVGIATIWRWAKERSDFPKPIRLSARCTVFDGDQLTAWRNSQGAKAQAGITSLEILPWLVAVALVATIIVQAVAQ
jgi:prophage regulatory protein